MSSRRIAIVGCRPPTYADDTECLYERIIDDVHGWFALAIAAGDIDHGDVIVSGGADGVDRRAAGFARELGLAVVEHLPDYATHGPKAPLVRNERIVADCDDLHAWPAPWSRGTWHAVRLARKAGKPVTVHEPWRQ